MTASAPGRHLPGGLAAFRRALRALGVIELNVALTAFSAAVVLNIVQIALRYMITYSIWWAQEVSLLLMMIAYFLGISCVFRKRQYVIVQFLVDMFPPRLQVHAYMFAQVLTVVFCLVVLVAGLRTAGDLLTTYSVILHFPEFYWTLPLLVAAVSIIATTIYFTLVVAAAHRRDPDAPLTVLEAGGLIDDPIAELAGRDPEPV